MHPIWPRSRRYDDVLVTLLGDVATTYIGIRTLQQQIDIAQDNVVKQRKALAIARDRFHGGTATGLDVFQAENVLAQTESTIPQLTAQLQQGEDALRVLLGMTPELLDTLLAGPTAIPVPPTDVAVGIPADLIRRRPDIRSAELQGRRPERADRHRQGGSVSGIQPDRRALAPSPAAPATTAWARCSAREASSLHLVPRSAGQSSTMARSPTTCACRMHACRRC